MSVMKVKDLVKLLKRANPNSPVILQGDPEGNFFNTISGVAIGKSFHSYESIEHEEIDPYDEDVALIMPLGTIYP